MLNEQVILQRKYYFSIKKSLPVCCNVHTKESCIEISGYIVFQMDSGKVENAAQYQILFLF